MIHLRPNPALSLHIKKIYLKKEITPLPLDCIILIEIQANKVSVFLLELIKHGQNQLMQHGYQ